MEAAEALAIGLATRVVPADRCEASARPWPRSCTSRASSTVHATKDLFARLRESRTPDRCRGRHDRRCYGSADFREGVAAFREGRKPKFA